MILLCKSARIAKVYKVKIICRRKSMGGMLSLEYSS